MKRMALVGAFAAMLAVALVGYYWSAWSVARTAAVQIAAGDENAPVSSSAWSLGTHVPHGRLGVQTHSGWIEASNHLVIPFTVRDNRTSRSVDLGVDVEFTIRGWHVVGAGDLGG